MRFLINALSVTNQSGRHVLMGHMSRVARLSEGLHEFVFCYHRANADLVCDLGAHVEWIECPPQTSHWLYRSLWEKVVLPRRATEKGCHAYFSPAGVAISGLRIPQIIYCLNPWCLVDSFRKTVSDKAKAAIQRYAYRNAMDKAAVMVFLSQYMHDAYRLNAGRDAQKTEVVYCGISDETFDIAKKLRRKVTRIPNQIVTVSAMGNHKGVETVLQALAVLRDRYQVTAKLKLIGAWPDARYRRLIDQLIEDLTLSDYVDIHGHVSTEELHRAYAQSKIYSLMSQCESFGIPAVDAQAFGTPVVCSNVCAMPEIGGEGGVYPEVNDPEGTAAAYYRLLTDPDFWREKSEAARRNVNRFCWDKCANDMLRVFNAQCQQV
jgi:glycosyltransferase involved in cell wall biosynthesis